MIIDVLKAKYSLPCLLEKLHISKSSYYYQEKVLSQQDKYLSLRIHIKEFLVWYYELRIKKSLGYMSPMEYRRSLGLAA